MTEDETKTGINNFFKYNSVGVVDHNGDVYVGRQFAGRYVAVLVFADGPVPEKTEKIEKSTALMPSVIEMYNSNPSVTIQELATTLGVDRNTIKRCIGKINLQTPGRLNIKSGQKLTAKEIMPAVSKLIRRTLTAQTFLLLGSWEFIGVLWQRRSNLSRRRARY
jgi:hypothetical protein